MNPAAWHPDPTGRHELRYWDGSQWTDHVADNGEQAVDPLHGSGDGAGTGAGSGAASTASETGGETSSETGTDSDWVGGPESSGAAPGGDASREDSPFSSSSGSSSVSDAASATSAERPAAAASGAGEGGATPFDAATMVARPAAEPAAEQPAQPADLGPAAQAMSPQAVAPQGGQPMGGPMGGPPSGPPAGAPVGGGAVPAAEFGGITGELIDGRFSEVDGLGPVRQNSRMLRVRVAEPFMAKQGAMVAYQGNVGFNYQSSGAGKFLKKAFTGEGLSLMRVEGQGDVFLADGAKHVHILHLNNAGLSVNGNSVLAFSTALEWNVERVKGGSIAAGGLFNTTLRGTGWVAITTDGDPVVLNAASAPTFADANALVAWSVHLQTSINSTFTAGSLIGRGSGEAFQVAFNGHGFVIVQPSEGNVVPPHSH